jgi:outer membrane protein assembly factor BamB
VKHPAFLALALLSACAGRGEVREAFVAPADVLQVRWRQQLTDMPYSPAIEYKPQEFAAATSDGQRVYVGSSAGAFYAFDARDGHTVWNKKIGGVTGRPRVSDDGSTVYVGTLQGALWAFEASSGRARWHYDLKAPIETQPAVSGNVVFFTSGENRIYALDAEKGTWKWQYDREIPESSFTIRGSAGPLVYGGRVYAGFSDGYLAALNPATGEVVWARSLGGEATRFIDVDSTPVVVDGVMYVSSFAGGVHALDPKDGSVKWKYDVEGAGAIRVGNNRVYFSASKFGLYALDLEGRLLWRQSLSEGGELSAPLVLGPYVMVSSAGGGSYLSGGGTYIADARTGHLLQYFFPGHGVTAEPTTDGRQVYILSNNGFFYALGLGSGPTRVRGSSDVPPV